MDHGQDGAARLQLHGRELRPLYAHPQPRPAHPGPGHGAHRRQDEHEGAGDRHSLPGHHHQGQRHGHRRWRQLLPGAECCQGRLRGRTAARRHRQPHDDQHPYRDGLDGPRRAARQPRPDQCPPASGRRCRHRAVGRQGDPHRDQGHRAAARPGRQHGAADEGRAREARADPRGRGPAAGRDPQGRRREAGRRARGRRAQGSRVP